MKRRKRDKVAAWIIGVVALVGTILGEIAIVRYAVIMPFKMLIQAPTVGVERLADVALGFLVIIVGGSLFIGLLLILILILTIILDYL